MSRVDIRRDKSTEKRQDAMFSPDRAKKDAQADGKESIYDKVRRKVDDIVRLKEEPRLFRKSPDRHQSAKLFEKKHVPLIGQSYEEEESRELNIIKDKIPDIEERPCSGKEIYVQRVRIHPVAYNKPISAASTVKERWTGDSSFSGSDIKDIREKVLFLPTDSKHGRVNTSHDIIVTNKHSDYKIKYVEPFCNEIQAAYSTTYKLREKTKLHVSKPVAIISRKKEQQNNEMSSQYTLIQHLSQRESLKTASVSSQSDNEELIALRESKTRAQNEMKFLSRSIEQLQKSVADLQDELRVSKFDRDNAITNFNQASKKIHDLNVQMDSLQRKSQKTSSQFGEIIDYVYRQSDDRYVHRLEDIIGSDEKKLSEEAHTKLALAHKKLAEIAQLVAASKDKKLAERVSAVAKR